MKKIFLALTLLFTMVLTANAQFYAGGSLSLHTNKGNCEFAISPEVGYTFQNNTGVGCVFDFAYDKATKATGFGVNPYFEYDFCTIGDKFTFYTHTYLHYAMTSAPGMLTDHTYGVSLHPGVIWSVTDHWSAAFYVGGIEYLWNQPGGTAFKDGYGDFNLGLSTSMPFAVALYYGF